MGTIEVKFSSCSLTQKPHPANREEEGEEERDMQRSHKYYDGLESGDGANFECILIDRELDIFLLWVVYEVIGDRIFDMILDISSHSSSPKLRIEGIFGDEVEDFCIASEGDTHQGKSSRELVKLEIDDFFE